MAYSTNKVQLHRLIIASLRQKPCEILKLNIKVKTLKFKSAKADNAIIGHEDVLMIRLMIRKS